MAEYIDINQLWKCETCYHNGQHGCALGIFGCDHGESYRPAYSKLKKADVAPVVHGRWINEPPYRSVGGYYLKAQECSVCRAFYISDGNKPYSNHNYCPNCGSDMRGDG